MGSIVKVSVPPDKYALVDLADADVVKKYRWRMVDKGQNKVYIYGKRLGFNKVRSVNLARLIAGATGVQTVAFKNNDPLDCRRENLELVDRRKDIGRAIQRSSIKRSRKRSKYRGVTQYTGRVGTAPRWKAYIRVSGRFIYLGRYATEDDAAKAYDLAALQHFGPDAKLNFPRGQADQVK